MHLYFEGDVIKRCLVLPCSYEVLFHMKINIVIVLIANAFFKVLIFYTERSWNIYSTEYSHVHCASHSKHKTKPNILCYSTYIHVTNLCHSNVIATSLTFRYSFTIHHQFHRTHLGLRPQRCLSDTSHRLLQTEPFRVSQ